MKYLGVSIVICCHNSSKVIENTLLHLAKQQVTSQRQWEIILVDNGSIDNTIPIVKKFLSQYIQLKEILRIVKEKNLGLANARNKGYFSSKYDIISFIDDDNLVSPNWVDRVGQIMESDPHIGVCGGQSKEPPYLKKPFWFEKYKECYAIGRQGKGSQDITSQRGFVWGAGMSVRKKAWKQLIKKHFTFFLQGRLGEIKNAGEDSELCFALRLDGWKVWYDDRLIFIHAISQDRLSWSELRKMFRGFGVGRAGHDPYFFAEEQSPTLFAKLFYMRWYGQVCMVIFTVLVPSFLKSVKDTPKGWDGNPYILKLEHSWGRICFLLSKRSKYDQYTQILRHNFKQNNI